MSNNEFVNTLNTILGEYNLSIEIIKSEETLKIIILKDTNNNNIGEIKYINISDPQESNLNNNNNNPKFKKARIEKKKEKGGEIKYINISDPQESNLNNNNNNPKFKKARIEKKKEKGEEIHIEWISVEGEYIGKGYSDLLLYIFLITVKNFTPDLFITLDDYSDPSPNLKINNVKRQICIIDNENTKKELLELLDEAKKINFKAYSQTRLGTKYSQVDKLEPTTYWKSKGALHTTNDCEAFISSSKIPPLINGLETKIKEKLKIDINDLKKIKEELDKNRLVGGSQYIMTKKGKRKIHVGKRGGKYYIMNKKKIYIK